MFKESEEIKTENMTKYRHKKTGQIGEVIHAGITTTLKFEDGTESILTPANLKRYWQEIKEIDYQNMTYAELESYMLQFNSEYSQDNALKSAVIVFTEDSFNKKYTEKQRSYRVWNNNRAFQYGKIATSLFGSCLDGTDNGVRLDWYMKARPEDGIGKRWKVERCYLDN